MVDKMVQQMFAEVSSTAGSRMPIKDSKIAQLHSPVVVLSINSTTSAQIEPSRRKKINCTHLNGAKIIASKYVDAVTCEVLHVGTSPLCLMHTYSQV